MTAVQEHVLCGLIRWLKLALALVILCAVWLLILPRVARLGPVRQHIQQMESHDIVVDAMFYTELNWDAPPGAVFRDGRISWRERDSLDP